MFSNLFKNSQTYESAYPIIKETLPKSSLGYGTNNKYPEFPPLMSDGRSITASFQPEAVINKDIIDKYNIQSNWQYRKYLTENAKKIMEYNFRESSNDTGYYMRHNDLPMSNVEQPMTMSATAPFTAKSFLDNSKPFGYVSSDLKEIYLTREQLEARKISPVITQEEIVKQQSSRK